MLFGAAPAVIGMVHVAALPGTPRARLSLGEILAQATGEARILREQGVDAVLVENMHDRPYLAGAAGPEVVACMTRVARAVKRESGLPCGVQVLAAANAEALAVALAAELDFIRVEGFVFAHVADEGWIEGCAGPLLRLRRQWGAEHVRVFVDIKKKHGSHAITADVSLAETARAAEFFLADGVIVTGTRTGQAADLSELKAVRAATHLPVLVGSGISPENAPAYGEIADGLIVGSALKEAGDWAGALMPARVAALMQSLEAVRKIVEWQGKPS